MNRSFHFCEIATGFSTDGFLSGCSQGSDRDQLEHSAQGISQSMALSQGATTRNQD